MGILGKYLFDARQASGIDIRDAASRTRISVQFLTALETEHFEKLPGELFVKGFLKSYAKFLHLDEAEVMVKYEETRNPQAVPAVPAAAPVRTLPEAEAEPAQKPTKLPVGPFVWGLVIVAAVAVFLFAGLPAHRRGAERREQLLYAPGGPQVVSAPAGTPAAEKLYLEVVAVENTWILVRTDASPQKKAVLNKGESLIWSADDRFVLSFGSSQAVKLMLNGKDLQVDDPKNTVVRDLVVTANGIINHKAQPEHIAAPRAKRKTAVIVQQPVQPPVQAQPQQPKQEPPQQQPATKPQPLAPITVQQAPEPQPQPLTESAQPAPTPEPAATQTQ